MTRRSPDAALPQVLALVALQLVFIRDFPLHLDLHLPDEVFYFFRGMRFVGGDVGELHLAWGPLYSLVYGALHQLLPDAWIRLDAMFVLAALGSTLGLFWCARPLLPYPAPLLLAAWWAASPAILLQPGLAAPQHVYLFSFGLLCLWVGLLARERWWSALAAALALFLCRTDFLQVILAAGALLTVAWLVRRRRGLRRPALATLVLGLALAGAAAATPGVSDRAWLAFRQHYAQVEWEMQGRPALPPGKEPFGASERWMKGTFPSAESMGAALAEGPGAVARHAVHNLGRLPGALAAFLLGSFPHLPLVGGLWAGVSLLLAGAWLLGRLRRRGSDPPLAPPPGDGRLAAWVAAGSTFVLLPLILMLKTRRELLLPLSLPLLLLVGGWALQGGAAAWRAAVSRFAAPAGTPGIQRRGRLLLGLLPALLLAAGALLPARYSPRPAPPLLHRTSLAMLQRALPRGRPALVFGAHVGCYLKLAAREEEHQFMEMKDVIRDSVLRGQPFGKILAWSQADLVLVSPALVRFKEQFPDLPAAVKGGRGKRRAGPPGYVMLRKRGR